MNELLDDKRLNDYVDGELSAAETAAVERLLAASAEARATVVFLRSLRERAARLPAAVEPPRDLWPDIESRMAPAPLTAVDGAVATPEAGPSDAWWPRLQPAQWATLAVAALFLVVASSALTAWMIGLPMAGDGAGVDTAAIALEAPMSFEARYALEIDQLLEALEGGRDTLDPDTVSTIETNVRVIDRAIARAREALADDPGNPGLSRMLDSNYRHKLELLQRAQRIIEMS